jgi:hypothetical protein
MSSLLVPMAGGKRYLAFLYSLAHSCGILFPACVDCGHIDFIQRMASLTMYPDWRSQWIADAPKMSAICCEGSHVWRPPYRDGFPAPRRQPRCVTRSHPLDCSIYRGVLTLIVTTQVESPPCDGCCRSPCEG